MLESGGVFSSLIIFMAAGIFAGLVINCFSMLVKLTRSNFIVVFAVDFLSVAISGLIFYIISMKYYYSSLNLYFIICFLTGIIFECIFIKNLVANPIKYVYNKIKKKKQ